VVTEEFKTKQGGDPMIFLGKQCRALRFEVGASLECLSGNVTDVTVSISELSKFERGLRILSDRQVRALLKVFQGFQLLKKKYKGASLNFSDVAWVR
jgi:hypothetical protein